MKRIIILLFISVTFCSTTLGFDIVNNGRIKCSIVSEKDATVAEKNAAVELQKYLQKITASKIPIVDKIPGSGNMIVVGATAFARKNLPNLNFDKLVMDTVIINCHKNTLYLAGDRPRGTVYAVYTFLEKYLKCGFWTPEVETVPSKETITLGKINYRYAPPFSYRQVFSDTAHRYRAFAVKLKLNGEIWSKPISEKLGGSFKIDIAHTLTRRYLNPEKYFDKHPDWYSYRKKDKKRHKANTQICTSNPAALVKLTEEIMVFMAKNPDERFLSVSFADNNNVCQCSKCEALVKKYNSNSALSVTAANYVASKVIKKYPNLRIVLMAYWTTEKPPAGMKLAPNIAVCFAMLDRNHGLPVCRNDKFIRYLREWKKLSHNQVYIWDYYAAFSNFLVPYPSLLNMESNIRTYREFGAKGIFAQLPFGSISQLVELKTWIFAKLVWNPSLNEQKLIAQFLKANYGKAAPYISEYIYMLNRVKGNKWVGTGGTKKWLPVKNMIEADKFFEKAQTSVADNQVVAKRIRKLKASILMAEINRYDEFKKARQKMQLPIKTRTQLIDELEAIGKEFKCSCYKEWDSFSNLIKKLRK